MPCPWPLVVSSFASVIDMVHVLWFFIPVVAACCVCGGVILNFESGGFLVFKNTHIYHGPWAPFFGGMLFFKSVYRSVSDAEIVSQDGQDHTTIVLTTY